MEKNQRRGHTSPLSNSSPPNLPQNPYKDPDFFAFLRKNEEKYSKPPSFFSENGLGQDIIQVTGAEPDICLEVFYALENTLWPQIEKQADFSFKDAWTRLIGGPVFKGILCPPERLIAEKRVRDLKRSLSEPEGESRVFQDLDGVIQSILDLKQRVEDHDILSKKEIIASLNMAQEFYQSYRNKVKGIVQNILEKEQTNALYASESDMLEDLLEPKAVMLSDIFDHHWAYRIPRNKAQKLLSLDTLGRNIKNNQKGNSNHRVIALPERDSEPLVFFKASGNPPIQPENEFMLYSFYRHFQIPVAETALLVLIDVLEANPDYFYAVQASEAVLGESSLKACQDQETVFDHEACVNQIMGAFLTNPSDGSFKNLIYSAEYKTLVSIDNNMVFKPELAGKNDKKTANVKSMLYLLDKMNLPIPECVHTFFTSLDPEVVILLWLQDLCSKNKEWDLLMGKLVFQKTRCIFQNLLPESQVPDLAVSLGGKVFVDPKLHSSESLFSPCIKISGDMLRNITEKLRIIEKTLVNNRSVSPQVLFEEMSPVLGKYYRKLRLEFSDAEEALEALWGNKKNGIDYSYLSALLDPEEFSEEIAVIKPSETLNPETFFKEYKEKLLDGELPIDTFIRRHGERRKKNALNFRVALEELRFFVQEGLVNSRHPQDIVDFCYGLSAKVAGSDHQLVKELTLLLSNLPNAELKWLFTLEKHFLRPDRRVPKDLVQSSVAIIGAFMKQRTLILTESEKQSLFDQQGNIKKITSQLLPFREPRVLFETTS